MYRVALCYQYMIQPQHCMILILIVKCVCVHVYVHVCVLLQDAGEDKQDRKPVFSAIFTEFHWRFEPHSSSLCSSLCCAQSQALWCLHAGLHLFDFFFFSKTPVGEETSVFHHGNICKHVVPHTSYLCKTHSSHCSGIFSSLVIKGSNVIHCFSTYNDTFNTHHTIIYIIQLETHNRSVTHLFFKLKMKKINSHLLKKKAYLAL